MEEKLIESSFLRLPQIIGNPKAKPPIPAILPVSRSTFLAGVKSGIFPKGVLLSKRCRAWRTSEILGVAKNVG
jgi:hypothetical protein